MRSPTALLLAASLAINLAALWWYIPSIPSSDSVLESPPAPSPAPSTAPTPATDSTSSASPPAALDWDALLASADFTPGALPNSALVSQLRAAGVPLPALRAILRTLMDQAFAPRDAAIWSKIKIPSTASPSFDARSYALRIDLIDAQLSREKNVILRQLLGDDAESPAERADRQRHYGDLPVDLADQLNLIELEHDFTQALDSASGQRPNRTGREAVDARRDDAIAALLSPDQYAAYQQLNSAAAQQVSTLASYVTDPKLRERIRLAAADLPPDADRTHIDQSLAANLAPDDFAELQRVNSRTYREANRVVRQLDLPPATAAAVYTAQQQFDAAEAGINANVTLTDDLRDHALEKLEADFRQSLGTLLTPDGASAYRNATARPNYGRPGRPVSTGG